MNWYFKVFKQYLDFSGRARRKEIWMFTFINFGVSIVLSILDGILGTTTTGDSDGIGFLYLVYWLLSIIPSLAVSVRRLHDIGKSGWWVLINMIPIVGPIWFLVLICMDSDDKPNQWGDNPKGVGNDGAIDLIGVE
jgi:uncharacterized membrane protein YhaH (DUF805 family)